MEGHSRTANTYRNLFWGTSARIIGMVCPFIFRAVIIRRLGAEYIGLGGLFKSILHVLNMSELGFGSAITFMMYKPVAENNLSEIRKLLNAMRKIYKVVGFTVLFSGCMVYPVLNILVKNNTGVKINIYLLYSMYLFNVVYSYLAYSYRSTLFWAYQRYDILSKISLVIEILKYSSQAVVLFTTNNYYLYILVLPFTQVLHNFLYYFVSKRMFPDIYCEGQISSGQKKMIRDKVVPLLGHRIGGTVIISIDDIIISSVLGISVLAQYDNYYYILSAITAMLGIFRSSVVASLGNKLVSSSKDSLFIAYKKVYFLWIMTVGWCACFLIGLYQPFIKMWVGEKYVYSDKYMIWICIYFFTWQFRYIGITMKEAAGLWEPDRWKPIIGMSLNLVFSFILVKVTGSILGVLWPTIVIMLFVYFPWETNVLFTRLFATGLKEYLILTMKCCGSVVVAVTLIYLFTFRIPMNGIHFFALRFLLCVIIPLAVFTVVHGRTEQYQSAVNDIKTIIRKIRG